ncbi:MAG: hypothetical protein JXB14_00280 [Candidatus Altiarchaeota archaeon]|nr:hypothetical protein [Candidatus Altiarchaeota archaeon]
MEKGWSRIEKLLKAGDEANKASDTDRALEDYSQVLTEIPKSIGSLPEEKRREVLNHVVSQLYDGLGRMLQKMDEDERALTLYEKALTHANDPDMMARINKDMVQSYITQGNFGLASECFKNSKLYSDKMLPRELELFKGQHMGLPVDKCIRELEGIKGLLQE